MLNLEEAATRILTGLDRFDAAEIDDAVGDDSESNRRAILAEVIRREVAISEPHAEDLAEILSRSLPRTLDASSRRQALNDVLRGKLFSSFSKQD